MWSHQATAATPAYPRTKGQQSHPRTKGTLPSAATCTGLADGLRYAGAGLAAWRDVACL
jgi:hypothetical protein